MIKKSGQINKMGVKKQENKSDNKKKVVNKEIVWECLSCHFRVISKVKPIECTCSQANYVINLQYKVGD